MNNGDVRDGAGPPRPKVLVVAGLAGSLVNFRGPLLRELTARGFRVFACANGYDDQVSAILESWGIPYVGVRLHRSSLNLFGDLRYLLDLWRLMRRERPDIVWSYTHKPVVYASAAAFLCAVPHVISMITGLGYAFVERGGVKRNIARRVLLLMYRLALKRNRVVFFQNPDDRAHFKALGLLPRGAPCRVTNGSGVDLDHYAWSPIPAGPCRFLLIARLLADKGIREYAAAARALKREFPDVIFDLVGPVDPNPAGLAAEEVENWARDGFLIYHGEVKDVRPLLAAATVYVLPSYREGTPRTVLEAMSAGRPIITTDAPGCRETVIHEKNGFLVPVGDATELIKAMRVFIVAPGLAEKMGKESVRIARRKYDVEKVNRSIIDAVQEAIRPLVSTKRSQ